MAKTPSNKLSFKLLWVGCVIFLTSWSSPVLSFLEPGKWAFNVSQKSCHLFQVHKALYAGSMISIRILCDPSRKSSLSGFEQPNDLNVSVGWVVRQSPCYEEYFEPEVLMPSYLRAYYECPFRTMGDFGYSDVLYFKKPDISLSCNHLIDASLRGEVDRDFKRHSFTANESRCIDPHPMACDSSPSPPVLYSSPSFSEGGTSMNQPIGKLDRRRGPLVDTETLHRSKRGIYNSSPGHQIVVPAEGMYLVILKISVDSTSSSFFDAQVELEMKTPFGYLSAVEHPLLIFYGVMSLVYVAFAIGWTIVSALQWRDLLRIQFWIGAVILLGMLEKAVFYAEHSSVNSRGVSVEGAVLFAELLSCLKRTLARMLVIIVSLGFGIIKPRLGSMFHRVISIGILYFALSAIECVLRLYRPKNDPTNQAMMAGVPLAVLDSIICYWVYNSLVQTTRTLNLRRNLVKLSLYTKFTNTLIAAVISSMAFMIWEIHTHKLTSCLIDWQRLWIDEAFWHIQFSIVLLVIMILWRPTKNNQRYAFTQLLDGVDEDTESGELFNKDLYDGMTLRQQHNNHIDSDDASVKSRDLLLSRETEEDLKWVEQNIVSSFAESAMPSLLDSDDELLVTQIERNKME